MSKCQFSCLKFLERGMDLLFVTLSRHIQCEENVSRASCPLFERFEGGGGCQNIFTNVSITALPQVLWVIDVFLRVLAVNNVDEPQETLAQGRFS